MKREESRTQRADALRNRQRLMEVAFRAFSSGDEPVTLEAIAREAGVGIGTLYRHFPTREALVEAVYRTELSRLRENAEQLLATHPADVALRAWMDGFSKYVAAKHGMAETLRAIAATGAISKSETHGLMIGTIQFLLDAGRSAGSVRSDVDAEDIFASLTGIFLASGSRDQAARMLDLLMHGLRPAVALHPTPR
ncbi:MAG TPA: TetR family transcriptional regulator [Candidatus Dormibacteraeota bacterium]|jgi:AcrR family transcriptional regulator|nr:TetR family transcriptional regulator [Candidatus Dormibacteraeota bacterium]